MLKPSDFNNAVPQFSNGNYASNPINPQYVEEPSSTDYNRGAEPLQTLPAQWWNWFMNKFTSRFNKVNIYVKNLFNELAQLLSLVDVTPDGTEGDVTDGQLKNAFKELYPDYINTKLALESTYVKKTQKVNNHALSGDVTVTKSDVDLGNVPNVSTNDQTPTYTEESTLSALSSGEKLSIAFGKLAKAVSSLISHIDDTSNPHSVTKAQLGLGNVVNTGDSAIPTENGTDKFTNGGAYTLKKDLIDIAESLPTDAVLHYSFDEVPDYPDGTAVYFKNKNFTETTDWMINATRTVLSIDNGCLKVKSTGDTGFVQIYGEQTKANKVSGKIIKMIFHSDVSVTFTTQDNGGGYNNHNYNTRSLGNGDYVVEDVFEQLNYQQLLSFNFNNVSADNYVIIKSLYIGDSSYSVPIIDNANGQYNAINNGILSTKGVSGKGIYLLKGKNATIDGTFQITKNFSISVWVKPEERSTTYGVIFVKNNVMYLTNGRSWDSAMVFGLYGENSQLVDALSVASVEENRLIHIVVTREGTTLKVYIDGTLSNTVTLSDGTIATNSNNCLIGSQNNAKNQMIDDLLIFDRALSDDEVAALYLNKANTPKFYDINNYNIDNATPVPAQNSNNLFTTGGAFDFFGQSTTSDSWLGKVFGRLLGRFWKHRTVKSGFSVNGVKYINGKYFAYGITGSTTSLGIFTSDDKVNWAQCSYNGSLTEQLNINDIQYNNNIYHALGFNNAVLLWSSNGIEWNDCTGIGSDDPLEIAYGNNIWVVACFGFSEENSIYWSANGKTFTRCTVNNMTVLQMHSVTFANGMFVAGCVNKGIIWSEDGKIFTQGTGFPSTLSYFDKIIYNNGIWVAGSTDLRGDYRRGLWWSTDGKAWTQGTGPNVSSVSVRDMKFLNGKWIAIGKNDVFTGFLSSVDGKAWVQITLQTTTLSYLDSVDYANCVWIVTAHDSGNYEAYAGESLESVKLVHTGAYSLDTEFKDIIFNQGSWFIGQGDGYAYSDFSTLDENELTD